MVMGEVLKDKEKMIIQEFKEDEYGSKEVHWKADANSDDDFNSDDEDNTLRSIRENWLAELKAKAKELVENKAKGYGEYREIG